MARAESRREPWPIAVAGMLALMIGTSLTFYWIASRHPDPPVVDDAYEAGLAVNDVRRARERALALGWALRMESEPVAEGARVRVTLRDAQGAPVQPEAIRVERQRPAEGGYDRVFDLAADGAAFELG